MVSGGPPRTAPCAFFIIRASFCRNIPSGTGETICIAATDPNGKTYGTGIPLWKEFTAAGNTFLNTNGSCLGVTFGAFGDIRRWVSLHDGEEDCKSVQGLPGTE
jgi:hypothetical protein